MTADLAISVTEPIENTLTDVFRFVPNLVAFLAILFIGWMIAKLVRKIANKLLERLKFEKVVERSGIGKLLAKSDYTASGLIAKLIYYAILLLTLQLSFGVFGPNPVSELLSGVVSWIPKAVVAIVIVVVASAIARVVSDLIRNVLSSASYGRLLATIAEVFIVGLGVIAALDQIGVATTVTTPVLVTVLATIGAILAIGVGGGLVKPMQQRWESWLTTAEREMPRMRQTRDGASNTSPESSSGDPAM
jgi:hypothetical protein